MKKISIILLVAVVSCAFFSSCAKDEVTSNIKKQGTQKIYVRGYSVANLSPSPVICYNELKNISEPVAGYEIKLANGQTYISDADGVITITLEIGNYRVLSEKIPSGYYAKCTFDTSTISGGKTLYSFKVVQPDPDAGTSFNDIIIPEGVKEREIKIFK